ncbi:hypothetical protein NQP46_21125 [Streptomyces albus]|nr:hypothetical protein NQP46_21125 [Streptomyces albus]
MAHDYVPAPLGSRHDVLATVARVLPEADLSDPAWGDLSGPTWSIELGIGARDPVDSMMLHIRGAGDDVLTPVFELAGALGCKVFDCSAGDLIAPGDRRAGTVSSGSGTRWWGGPVTRAAGVWGRERVAWPRVVRAW